MAAVLAALAAPAAAQQPGQRIFVEHSLSRSLADSRDASRSVLRWRQPQLPTPANPSAPRFDQNVRPALGGEAGPALNGPFEDAPLPRQVLAPPTAIAPDERPVHVAARQPYDEPVADPNCRRIYNGRNCCVEEEACLQARSLLTGQPITAISLNITPAFRPQNQAVEEYRTKEQQLAKAPVRAFRNRAGEVIAEGRLIDYVYGRILVETDDGRVLRIPDAHLSEDDLCFVTAWWELPGECRLGDEPYQIRNWVCSTFTWKASSLCHKPLYFEEEALERYGHTTGPFSQPFVSGAHFFLNVAFLPYQMGMYPPTECMYALGYYRPGSCAPWLVPPIPLSARGAAAQAGAVAAGVVILP